MPSRQKGVVKAEQPVFGMILDRSTRRDLNVAILSVVFGMAYFIITGYPGASPLFTAYLKDYLGISDSAYGLILTLPFITVLIQIPFTAYVSHFGRIKSSYLVMGILSKLMLLVLALLPFIASNIPEHTVYLIVVVVILMTSTFNWIADSAINTWFGAMIPTEIKGRYFSTRQMIYTMAMLVYALAMSQLLKVLADWTWKFTFFFSVAVLFGLVEILFYFLVRPPEKSYLPWFHNRATQKPQTFTWHELISPLKDKRYRSYLLFAISWNFSLQIAGPYYNVYMLNTLKYSLGQMTLMTQIIPAVATILFLRKIGQAYDRFGFRPVLLLSCAISITLPFTWLFATPESNWFLFPANILSGTFNIGIELAIMSLAIFLAPHAERSAYLAMKNIAMSLVGFVPAIMLGGYLSDVLRPILSSRHLPFVRGQVFNPFHVLLFLSFLLRIMTLLVFARRLSEPSAVPFAEFIAQANAAGKALVQEKRHRLRQCLRKFFH